MLLSSLALVVALSGVNSWANSPYPMHPVTSVTPGSLCKNPDRYRYPEHIAYCERDVSTDTKKHVIEVYERMGFQIMAFNRQNFKIDHLIPLCMGGSNEEDNLWPQHRSAYEISDPAEQELCEQMASGRLSQAEAIEKIKAIKFSIR